MVLEPARFQLGLVTALAGVALWAGACSDGASGAGGGATGGAGGNGGSVAGGTAGTGGSSGSSGGDASSGGAAGGSGGSGGVAGGDGGSGGSGGNPSGGVAGSAPDASEAGDAEPDAGADAADAPSDAPAGDADAADAPSESGDAAPFCAPGAKKCSGDTLETCNASGSAYDIQQSCAPGKCSSALLACVACSSAADCSAPSNPCLAASCTAQGSCASTPLAAGVACGTGGVCNGSGTCGVCVPGTAKCTGQSRELCGADGQWFLATVCPYVCANGACGGVCVPGAKRCSANQPELCDASGQWKPAASCSGSTPSCHDGLCEPATPASCAALAGQCGPSKTGYCCASNPIVGGSFLRSYDAVSYTDSGYPATVSDLRLDAYEVTVARFRAFVSAGNGTQASPPAVGAGQHPSIPGSGWLASWNSKLAANKQALETALGCNPSFATYSDQAGPNDARPVNCVTWYEAFAFCAWDGARLPTEAEWNYAAAGGSEQRVFPWSSPATATSVDPTHASYYVDGVSQCLGDGVAGCSVDDILPAGSLAKGAGRYGNMELSGNVWEWVLDTYANPYPLPCVNCSATGGSGRTIRGGSFFGNSATIFASARSFATPESRLFSVGLRCAR